MAERGSASEVGNATVPTSHKAAASAATLDGFSTVEGVGAGKAGVAEVGPLLPALTLRTPDQGGDGSAGEDLRGERRRGPPRRAGRGTPSRRPFRPGRKRTAELN